MIVVVIFLCSLFLIPVIQDSTSYPSFCINRQGLNENSCKPMDVTKAPHKETKSSKPAPGKPPSNQQPPGGGSDPSNPTPPKDPFMPGQCPGCG